MKQILVAILMFLMFYQAAVGQTEADVPPRNIIKIDLFSPVYPAFFGYYERVMSQDHSLQFGVLIGNRYLMASGAYRLYLSEAPAPRGIFVSPGLALGARMGLEDERTAAYSLGLLVGAQEVFRQRISLEASLGPAYLHSDEGRFTIFGGIVIGIAFGNSR